MVLAAWAGAATAQEVHVAKYYGDRRAAVTYTFDDGLLEHYTRVSPSCASAG